ncbi:MAG: M23 family metallopeptidase [Candidatus Marinimicrobia bacterium]|nr:M23 family metallopeptidase [Candidatus Neomarinimicrobiota bacterium]
MKKYFFLNDTDDHHIIELNTKKILTFAGLLLLIIVTLSLFGAKFFMDYLYKARLSKVKQDNSKLAATVKQAQSKINQMESNISKLEKKDQALRSYINLPSIDKDINKIGIGGKIIQKTQAMDKLLPSDSLEISTLMRDLNRLERKIKLEKISYNKIYKSFQKYSDKIKSTPSIRPVNRSAYISDGFGYRHDPFTNERRFHWGLDYAAPSGTPVMVTADGVVRKTRYSHSYGRLVYIDHGNGYTTVYAHLHSYNVEPGDEVKRGQIIGKIGSTGRSTGPHLHYEVRRYGLKKNPAKYYFQGYLD